MINRKDKNLHSALTKFFHRLTLLVTVIYLYFVHLEHLGIEKLTINMIVKKRSRPFRTLTVLGDENTESPHYFVLCKFTIQRMHVSPFRKDVDG